MSALLQVTRGINNDVWQITFTLDSANLSESDKQLIAKFGEPTINVGGTFLINTADTYSLPDQYIRVRTDLPFTQTFDATTSPFNTNTQVKAQAFQDAFVANYTAAFVTLRATPDTFTGQYLFNV
jgi:hypothetical protein